MEWIWIILILLSTTSILGYYFKKRIDSRSKEQDRRRQHIFEDLKRQRALLQDFLGQMMDEFDTLHNAGNTYDENWRRETAKKISNWVSQNSPSFPEEVRNAMVRMSRLAGTMIMESTLGTAQHPMAFQIASEDKTTIIRYADEIAYKLTGQK